MARPQLSNSNLSVAGGAIQTVFVDCANQLLLAAMLDRVIRVYDLGSPQPLMKYEGHTDAVSSIGYLPDKGLYVSGSWDSTLRLWKQPGEQRQRRAREHVIQQRERHAVGAGLYLLKPGKEIVVSQHFECMLCGRMAVAPALGGGRCLVASFLLSLNIHMASAAGLGANSIGEDLAPGLPSSAGPAATCTVAAA